MTGHQPHPGTGKLARGETGRRIPPEDIARGCGVEFVKIVNPDNLEETESAIKEALDFDGVTVLVFRRPCALLLKRKIPYVVDPEACKSCKICMRIGCPALSLISVPDKEKEVATIDADLCFGCGLCAQVCTCEAISPRDIVR
jgi:indolepyruvate ferredoxin oxidoreductase alpha subunit